MKTLRERGLEQGKITTTSEPVEVAAMMFESGVSTAQHLTDISGRGVGMNAVRSFLERAGGSIRVILEDPLDPAGDYYRFQLAIQLPLHDASGCSDAA
jgi:chemotaxis protein histidine kinase CheA